MVTVQDKSFLGRDFLTWLWFRCEVEGGEFDVGPGEDDRVALVVEDALALVSPADETVMSLRRGKPTLRPEAASALAAGMTLRKARLYAARGAQEWHFTLDGETLDVSSLKTSEPEQEPAAEPSEAPSAETVDETPDEKQPKKKPKKGEEIDDLADKLLAAEEASDLVHALYKAFLDVRLARDWDRVELPRLRDWVEKKLARAGAEIGLTA